MIRRKLAYFCFFLSSVFKSLGKYVLTKEKTILVDALSLPGWFILDNCIIYCTMLKKGFQWEYWTLPDQWIINMNKIKEKNNGVK